MLPFNSSVTSFRGDSNTCRSFTPTLFCSITPLEFKSEPAANILCVPQQTLENVSPQKIDFPHFAELLWTESNNFSRFEMAMKEQVGHTLLTSLGYQAANNLPQPATILLFFR